MRILSIVINIVLLIVVIFLVADEGWPDEIEMQLMVLVFFGAPIISIYTLWTIREGGISESWFGLFLERKKLEEKAKLKKLKEHGNET